MWTLLADPQAWEAFKIDVQQKINGSCDFGHGPKSFPCLVTSTRVGTTILSAYVYKTDATWLLGACEPAATAAEPRGATDEVIAHVMTIGYFLLNTGICKPAAYQEKVNEFSSYLAAANTTSLDDLPSTTREIVDLFRALRSV